MCVPPLFFTQDQGRYSLYSQWPAARGPELSTQATWQAVFPSDLAHGWASWAGCYIPRQLGQTTSVEICRLYNSSQCKFAHCRFAHLCSKCKRSHINRMGLTPKGHTPGKWRLITDLSYPEGASVNDGILPRLCSLHYTTVESVALAAQRLGKGTLLAKIDIKSAYRLVPVHRHDHQLLGIEWKGAYYVDGALPFGLRSAPKTFTAVADALQWVMHQNGVTVVDHYLDDFITMGPPDSACVSRTYNGFSTLARS